jgi:hypothetical protein
VRAATPVPVDPDAGITDLVRQLSSDSKHLFANEARLAKLEVRENIHDAARGTLWLAIAFGIATVALVALTIGGAHLIGRAVNGHYWLGAMIVGAVELVVALVLIKRGLHTFGSASFTLPESRETVKETARWVKNGDR